MTHHPYIFSRPDGSKLTKNPTPCKRAPTIKLRLVTGTWKKYIHAPGTNQLILRPKTITIDPFSQRKTTATIRQILGDLRTKQSEKCFPYPPRNPASNRKSSEKLKGVWNPNLR
ncbi:unnamed protein product [Nesidiocoris tenuis]|uniref:Uncharacterized protein n=1 Tax=Nesidiocoris tenuis TaxID=355587 RepID=A0A6H5H884_9HEMI|nr:unnamed protein product [Nesidiocoris tenuis]